MDHQMKRNAVIIIAVVITAIALIIFASRKREKVVNESFQKIDGITAEVREPSSGQATLYLQNDTDINYRFNYSDFDVLDIQHKKDNGWYERDHSRMSSTLTMKLQDLTAHTSLTYVYQWEDMYGKLPKGTYRIVYTLTDETGESNVARLCTNEFQIP